MTYHFGERVEALLVERGKTKKSLYDHLKMTGNGFDAMIKNNTMTAVRLAQIADFFGVPVSYFYGKDANYTSEALTEGKSIDGIAEDIKELKKFFEEELRIKNQQIAGLQRTVDVLVGKSEGAIVEPLFAGMDDFERKLLLYRLVGGLQMKKYKKSLRRSRPVAKLVAPR